MEKLFLLKFSRQYDNIYILNPKEIFMKRFLTLFLMLCLIFTAMAFASCGGGNDTDTDTDTSADTSKYTNTDTDTDTDTQVKEITYVITLSDQDGALISNARVSIFNGDNVVIEELTSNASGQVSVTLAEGTYYAGVTELPEYHLFAQDKVLIDSSDFSIVITNNTPNGTAERPYLVEDLNEITLEANGTVYYASYGGGRNLLIENAQGLKFTYHTDEPMEADEENKIYLKMPVVDDTNDRRRLIKLENTTDEEISFTLKIYSDKGAQDNPYDVVLDEVTKITVEKEKTVYYKYIAEKDGMIVVYSETSGNNISLYNTTSYVMSGYTYGSNCQYIYASQGDEVTIYVASIADKNYNQVEFKVSHYAGTEEEPIPLYRDSESTFTLQANQTFYFKEATKIAGDICVLVSGESFTVTYNQEEITPSEDGTVDITAAKEAVFAVTSTNEDGREDISILIYTPDTLE